MKWSTKWVTLLVVPAVVLALVAALGRTSMVSKAHADGDRSDCTRAAASGLYAAVFRGFVGTPPATLPVAAAGFLRLDADGTLSGKDTLSAGGAITPRVVAGTYTIGRDRTMGGCRGTATTNVGTFSFATSGEDGITGAFFVSTVPGQTVEGQAIRQGRAGDRED